MSTRSLVGGLTDGGTYVTYVHYDGYPDARLPVLEELIKRDGPARVLSTILQARTGGWSALEPSTKESHILHGEVVPGYGVKYTDAAEGPQLRFPEEYNDDSWCEYVYLIPEIGPIRYAEIQRGVKPEAWRWQEHEVLVQ